MYLCLYIAYTLILHIFLINYGCVCGNICSSPLIRIVHALKTETFPQPGRENSLVSPSLRQNATSFSM